jgi:hypothetical protein
VHNILYRSVRVSVGTSKGSTGSTEARATLCLYLPASVLSDVVTEVPEELTFGSLRCRGDLRAHIERISDPFLLSELALECSLVLFSRALAQGGSSIVIPIKRSRPAQPVNSHPTGDHQWDLQRFRGSGRFPGSIFARVWPPRPPGRLAGRWPAAGLPAYR